MITVKTQIGTGGYWYTEGRWAVGPRNLLAAVKAAQAAKNENRGVGGYRIILSIHGTTLSEMDYPGWPTTLVEARAALAL